MVSGYSAPVGRAVWHTRCREPVGTAAKPLRNSLERARWSCSSVTPRSGLLAAMHRPRTWRRGGRRRGGGSASGVRRCSRRRGRDGRLVAGGQTTGSSSRDDDRTVLRLLVPTLACRKFMIAGVSGSWSSLVSTSRMRWPAANRRALGTNGIRYSTSSPMGTATGAAAGQYRRAGPAGRLVDLAQAGPQPAGGDVVDAAVRRDVLQRDDPRGVGRRWRWPPAAARRRRRRRAPRSAARWSTSAMDGGSIALVWPGPDRRRAPCIPGRPERLRRRRARRRRAAPVRVVLAGGRPGFGVRHSSAPGRYVADRPGRRGSRCRGP